MLTRAAASSRCARLAPCAFTPAVRCRNVVVCKAKQQSNKETAAQSSSKQSSNIAAVLGLGCLLAASASAPEAHAAVAPLADVAILDASTAKLLENILRPTFTLFTFLYIVRIPMTWYPSIDGTQFPWNIAYTPTEPVLSATRKVIPLVGGVDITPIVWVGLLSFFNEILLGPQGLLLLIERQGGI